MKLNQRRVCSLHIILIGLLNACLKYDSNSPFKWTKGVFHHCQWKKNKKRWAKGVILYDFKEWKEVIVFWSVFILEIALEALYSWKDVPFLQKRLIKRNLWTEKSHNLWSFNIFFWCRILEASSSKWTVSCNSWWCER